MVRLKGVGRSPLSVARMGLLAVGPERNQDKVSGKQGGGGERKRQNKWIRQGKINCDLFCVDFCGNNFMSSVMFLCVWCVLFLPSKISNMSNSFSVWKLSKVMVTLYPFSTVTLHEHIWRLG